MFLSIHMCSQNYHIGKLIMEATTHHRGYCNRRDDSGNNLMILLRIGLDRKGMLIHVLGH